MKENVIIRDYCSGCGLCHSVYGVELSKNEKGFYFPQDYGKVQHELFNICPAGGQSTRRASKESVWGNYEAAYLGWAVDPIIRKKASSGGVLTAICCDLLQRNEVDGIIQTKAGENYQTQTVVCRSVEEVKECVGSRYCISSPLMNIKQLVRKGEKYAFVGKPCDVAALRLYLEKDTQLSNQIIILLSFFCAGMPSNLAQKKLLKELGCTDEKQCSSLQYRGNGWPGYATIIMNDGTRNQMSYNDSWGRILGRDVNKLCRFCMDGIGEMADISCGDAWYLDENNRPLFTESEGRNVIFVRNSKGAEILNRVVEDNQLHLEENNDYMEQLKYVQKYQYERRSTMRSMILGMQIAGRKVPSYDKALLKKLSKYVSIKVRTKRMLGIVKRAFKRSL